MTCPSGKILGLIVMVGAVAACSGSSNRNNTVVPMPADLREPNDTQGSCSGVVLDSSESGLSLHTPSDEDYFCFTLDLESDLTATATFDPAAGRMELELLDAFGAPVASGQPLPGGREIGGTVPCGDYALRVFSPFAEMNTYDLSITAVATASPLLPDAREPNDDPAGATILTDPRFGVINVPGLTLHDGLNEDWFTFPLGGTADVEVAIFSIAPVMAIDAELLDSSLNVIASGTLFNAILSPGDYFIRVFPVNCERSSYSLDVSVI